MTAAPPRSVHLPRQRVTDKHVNRSVVALAGVLFAVLAVGIPVFWWGSFEGPSRGGAVFGGIGAVLGFLALVAALTAVRYSIGSYLQWRNEQYGDAKFSVLVGAGHDLSKHLAPVSAEQTVSSGLVHVSVSISNQSDFVVYGAILNVVVLANCQISLLPGDDSKRSRVAQLVSTNDKIVDGRISEVRYLTAERDLLCRHWFSYPFNIQLPGPGTYPVLVDLDSRNGEELLWFNLTLPRSSRRRPVAKKR